MATKKTVLNADVFQSKRTARKMGFRGGVALIASTFGQLHQAKEKDQSRELTSSTV